MEVMGVASGCGCMEVNRFPHITYSYSFCICSFLQQHPDFFVHFFLCLCFLFRYSFIIKFYTLNIFLRNINTHTNDYRHLMAAI